ncbi:CARDB domain-containing protein [Salinibaculum salinum]|uniref:CARDB domain-containing protein n=1 Tax=Salinibaculum salinum TaxID=3131996 RepID=UPI0030EBC2C8
MSTGTTIIAVVNGDVQDSIDVGPDGQYGGSGPTDEKLRVDSSIDSTVHFYVKKDDGTRIEANEVDENPTSGTEQLNLTFPDGTASGDSNFEVSNLKPTEMMVTSGDTVNVSATITNRANAGTQTVGLQIDDAEVRTQEVTLDTDERTRVEFTDVETEDLDTGDNTHGVYTDDDSQTGTLTVEKSRPNFTVSDIDPVEATLKTGDKVAVSTTITNDGDAEGTQTVALLFDGNPVDNTDVTLAAGESTSLTFDELNSSQFGPGTYTHTVTTENDSQSGTVTIESRQPNFSVSELSPVETTVTEGTTVDVSATITNVGETTGTQDIELAVDETIDRTESITLDADDETTVDFSIDTAALGLGSYTHTVSTANDSQSGTLVVESDSPAEFRVTDLTPTDRTVTAGNTYDIAATVRNDGDQEATQQVQYRIDGDTVDRQAVTLASGGQTTVEFTDIETESRGAGTYTHGAYTNNDSQSGTLTVERNGSDERDQDATLIVTELDPSGTTVTRGTAVDVTASIRNDGQADETQSVQFRLDDEPIDSESITLGQGETTAVTFTAETASLAPGTYVYGVHTANDEQVGTLTVEDKAEQTPPEGTATPSQADETATTSTQRSSGTPAETTTTEDSGDGGGGGLIPDGLLRALLLYIGVPLAVIYGVLKAMAIYLGY